MTDLFSRLSDMGCDIYQFDVAEMISPKSLWELPTGWRPLTGLDIELPESIISLTNAALVFVGNTIIDSFTPAAVALGFQIEGDVNLDQLFAGVNDVLPEGAVSSDFDSHVLVREVGYVCAQVTSRFTSVCDEMVIDFESVTMFDFYVNPAGLDVLLQRTVVTSSDNDAPLPVFNNARPPR